MLFLQHSCKKGLRATNSKGVVGIWKQNWRCSQEADWPDKTTSHTCPSISLPKTIHWFPICTFSQDLEKETKTTKHKDIKNIFSLDWDTEILKMSNPLPAVLFGVKEGSTVCEESWDPIPLEEQLERHLHQCEPSKPFERGLSHVHFISENRAFQHHSSSGGRLICWGIGYHPFHALLLEQLPTNQKPL